MVDFSPKIGKLFGIDIQIHWTLIGLLIVSLLFSIYLFVVFIFLFICVLIHELMHSITSKRNKIKVKKIILTPLGGGSVIDFEKVNPDVEFRISIVGPIANFLLAAGFGILNLYTPPGIINVTVQALFLINIFLGIFNLLPWLPLDGGRVLKSYLQKTRTALDATKIAYKVSNIVTVLFVVGTIIYAALIPGYSIIDKEFIVLFDVMIAFFVYTGARAEMQSAIIKNNISDLKAKDAITKDYIMVKSSINVGQLYDILKKSKMHIVLFKDGKEIKIVSSELLQKQLKKGVLAQRITKIGISVPVVPYNTNLYSAIERMRSCESNLAAVIRGKQIVGILLMQHIESIIALHLSQKKKQQA
jgi:Zn-dependent protease